VLGIYSNTTTVDYGTCTFFKIPAEITPQTVNYHITYLGLDMQLGLDDVGLSMDLRNFSTYFRLSFIIFRLTIEL